MKKLTLLLFVTASIFTFSFKGATPAFEGKVTFDISMEGGNMPPEAMAMFAGSELTVYIKGSKSRSDISMAMQTTTTVSDMKTGTSVVLMDVMGNKYRINSDPSKDEKAPNIDVKYLEEVKTIAGYKCKRADLSFKDEAGAQQSTTIWYTEEIPNYIGNSPRNAQFKGIKGMPLEYEVKAEQGMKMRMTAKAVSKEPVDDKKFDIPSDYKVTTAEDMQKDMMKMMQGGGR